MWLNYIILVIGFVALVYGADKLVDGASNLARRLKVSELVIGLTIVAFGTSFPELIVNVTAAFNDKTDLALGNILGSNIFNVLGILGCSAIVYPLVVNKKTTCIDIPFALMSAAILWVICSDTILTNRTDNVLDLSEGIILLVFFTIFLSYVAYSAIKDREQNIVEPARIKTWLSITYILLGLVLLYVGGRAIVDSAVKIAQAWGVTERIIGLTIVGIGTSLPELATSVVAAKRKQVDIAIANIVGSNIFNTLFILGVTSVITPITIGDGVQFDLLTNIALTALLLGLLFIGKKRTLGRVKGALFLLLYIAYVIMLVIK